MIGLVQLRTYLYSKLSTDSDLTTLMGGMNIYDVVQENAVLPYIAYEQINGQKVHHLDVAVSEHIIRIVIVARADSSLTTHNIMARLEQIIDELPAYDDLTAGYKLSSAELLTTQIEQVDFEFVKGVMDIKLLITGGL